MTKRSEHTRVWCRDRWIAEVPISVNRWQWQETLASKCGPPSATTRHVMHAISIHMNPQGENAFPSIRKIALRTALSERAVTKHISLARLSGWIEVTTRKRPGGDWDSNQYRASVPNHVADSVPEVKRSTERGSVGTEPHDTKYRTSRQKVPNEVLANIKPNNSINGKPPCVGESAGVASMGPAAKAFADLYAENESKSKDRMGNRNRGNET